MIKQSLCNIFDISVARDTFEGILLLKLSHKTENLVLFPCVCYLPPQNSSRPFDVTSFYDKLLLDVYSYQEKGLVFICGY